MRPVSKSLKHQTALPGIGEFAASRALYRLKLTLF